MNLDALDAQVKSYGGGGGGSDMFEFEKGPNRVRILTFPTVIATHFFGKGNPAVVCTGIEDGCPFHKADDDKPSLKLVSYVIDRRDSKVKLAELPLSIRYSLKDLQETEGFDFADFPMPYDVQIMHDPDNNDPKSKYRTTGIPKMTPLTVEEEGAFGEAMKRITPEGYVDRRKAKARAAQEFNQAPTPPPIYPEAEAIAAEGIPF